MANGIPSTEPVRLNPADLRRRLTVPSAPEAAPPVVSESPVAVPDLQPNRRLRDLKSRLMTPESAQIDRERLQPPPATDDSANFARATPLPHNRLEKTELRRPDAPRAEVDSGTDILPELFRPVDIAVTSESLSQISAMVPPLEDSEDTPSSHDIEGLRQENASLRALLDETREILHEANLQEQQFAAREREYQEMIEDLNQQLTAVHEQFSAIEVQLQSAGSTNTHNTEELEDWANEIEKDSARLAQDRRILAEDRQQLREDEESLEQQMRQMEMQMARERATLARQETELKRLNADIQHELEMMSRGDAGLREQMQKFQRRHQEVLARTTGGMPSGSPPSLPPTGVVTPRPVAPEAEMVNQPAGNGSGLLRRLFRPRPDA